MRFITYFIFAALCMREIDAVAGGSVKESAISKALSLIASNNVSRVDVLYFPEDVETIATLSPKALESECWSKTIINRFQDVGFRSILIQSVNNSDFREGPNTPVDARWGCIFYDDKGNRILSIYLDKFGSGELNQISVNSNKNLLNLLRKKFALR